MDDAMTFEIFKAFPPDREGPVAELHATSGDEVEVPVQVFRRDDGLHVAIFAANGDIAWEFPLGELLDGLQRAAKVMHN